MTRHVISYHALSDGHKRVLTGEAEGPIQFSALNTLLRDGFRDMLRRLRLTNATSVTIAIEHDFARPLVGPMVLVAIAAGSRNISVAWPDGKVEAVSRRRAIPLLFDVFKDTALGYANLRLAPHRPARDHIPVTGNKVLYLDANLTFGPPAGGSIAHTKGVIDAMQRRGLEVDYASIRPLPTRAGKVPVPLPGLAALPSELNFYRFAPVFEKTVASHAARRDYSFLYQRMSLHNHSGAVLKRKLGLPLVLEYNGSEAWSQANWGARLRYHDSAIRAEAASLKSADLVVTVSDELGKRAEELGAANILVCPNGVDPEIFSPDRFSKEQTNALRDHLGIARDAKVLTFIGTFGTWHGADFLARAIKRLVTEDRAFVEAHKLHFLLIGDGLKMPIVRHELETCRQYVTLPGLIRQENAPLHLAASDIFLSPHVPNPDGSAFFGSPTKLFEYMAMERLIIASDLDQIGEVLRDSGRPLAALFRPGDEDSFLYALRGVAGNPPVETARLARKKVLAHHTWDQHVQAILDRLP